MASSSTFARRSTPVTMSKAMFDRQMKWRNEKDARVKTTRKELRREEIYKDNLGVATQDEHVESYYRYRQLVGEADGGEMLGEEAYSELQRKAAAAATDRLFVFYRCTPRALDCYTIGPDSRCYCAHSYKSHAWYNNKDKNVHCRVPARCTTTSLATARCGPSACASTTMRTTASRG